jgi:uncharacterized protein (DUF924 family)
MTIMSSSLSVATLAFSEFASKSFVQRACSSPMQPQAVLSFFFGVNYFDNEHQDAMREGTPIVAMSDLWYKPRDEYDELCRSFVPVVRAAGKKELTSDEWNGSVDGLVSQVLLCDQLSRNCFRGTEEAFHYDAVAEALTLKLVDEFKEDDTARSIPGEFFPSYVNFMILPLMHSEEIANHELGCEVIDLALQKFEGMPICNVLDVTRGFLLNHKQVVDQFGRYPHRNAKLGRTCTPEEQAWLADTENLPSWAKSQG